MKLYRRLLHPRVLTTLALIALVLLVWFFGPLLAFGEWRPLDSVLSRVLLIILILLVPASVMLFSLWQRRRKGQKLVEAVTAGPSAAEREGQVLQQRFKEALQILEDSARKTGRRSLLRRGQHLYDLPWYMFIGAPGSGKTTALMNAGLTFPLAGKLGQASVRGVGGTRNCEWWFTEEAVLIDTAGRYALQQSDEATDASAWKTFLQLLRKARPRRPINGVLLTVNVQDLLQQSPADRKEHALRLRTRLQELHQQLGVRPPVYVLVTKCDLLGGFNETFENLGREDREQVWGFSFAYDEDGHASATPMRTFGAEFDALEQRLREQLIERMQAESDVLKRAAVFAFPPQFAGIKGLLGGFLEQVFEGGAGLEEAALVRGVYFTSGTQEGSPIDRVLGTLGRTFGVDGRAAAAQGSRGKAFFLTRLLKEVIFREQGLVGVNRQQERRRRALRLATASAIGVAVVAIGVGWTLSYLRNQAYIEHVEARLPELKTAVSELPPATSAELSLLPQVLDRAAALPQPDGFELDAPPLLNTLGLYEGEHVAAGADIAYRRLLDKALLPRVTRRLEERLRAVDRNNLELAYESLKHYLMLYTPEHFDAESLAAFVGIDWDANLSGTLSAEQRQALGGHLLAAFQHGAPPPAAPMDEALVSNVREMLAVFPLEFRIFSRLQRTRVGAGIPDFTVAGAAGPNALRVFERASGQPLTNGVPGLFTRDGYLKAFRPAQARVSKALAQEQGWVMGTGASSSAVATGQSAARAAGAVIGESNDELDQKVRRLYLQEYIKVWDRYLDDVRLVRLDGLGTSRTVAGLLAAPDSPLKAYMIAVARETQLEQAVQAEGAGRLAQAAAAVQVERARQEIEMTLGIRPTGGTNADAGRPLEAMVDDHFAHIHRLVAGQPPPIDDVLKMFNEVFVQLTAIDAAQKSRTGEAPRG
jgi:type VI secretion system protein ImpL